MNAIQEIYAAKTEKLYTLEDLQRAFDEGIEEGKRKALAKRAVDKVFQETHASFSGIRNWNKIPNWEQQEIVNRMKLEFERGMR